jgi:hypothetical protein
MTDYVSPDPRNYAIFKGNCYFTPEGGARRHLGNVAGFSLEPAAERLDHFSSMAGINKRDRSVVVQTTATITMTLEEMTLENFKLALLGEDDEEATSGNRRIKLLAVSEQRGVLEFVGSNDVGPKFHHTFPSVSIAPEGAFEFIQAEAAWASLTVTAEVEAQEDGSFGTTELLNSAEEATEGVTA